MPSDQATHLREFTLARRMLSDASHVIVFTADGLSEESGIPPLLHRDTRWQGKSPGALARLSTFKKDPRLVWEWYLYQRRTVNRFEPNATHHALAKWEASCEAASPFVTMKPRPPSPLQKNVTLLTYSTFGLHNKAGHPIYYEAMGSIWRNRCTNETCKKVRDCHDFTWTDDPLCPVCHSQERPDVRWLDEKPDEFRDPASSSLPAWDPWRFASVRLMVGSGFERFRKDFLARMYLGSWIGKIVIDPTSPTVDEKTILLPFPAKQVVPQLLDLVMRIRS